MDLPSLKTSIVIAAVCYALAAFCMVRAASIIRWQWPEPLDEYLKRQASIVRNHRWLVFANILLTAIGMVFSVIAYCQSIVSQS